MILALEVQDYVWWNILSTYKGWYGLRTIKGMVVGSLGRAKSYFSDASIRPFRPPPEEVDALSQVRSNSTLEPQTIWIHLVQKRGFHEFQASQMKPWPVTMLQDSDG